MRGGIKSGSGDLGSALATSPPAGLAPAGAIAEAVSCVQAIASAPRNLADC